MMIGLVLERAGLGLVAAVLTTTLHTILSSRRLEAKDTVSCNLTARATNVLQANQSSYMRMQCALAFQQCLLHASLVM